MLIQQFSSRITEVLVTARLSSLRVFMESVRGLFASRGHDSQLLIPWLATTIDMKMGQRRSRAET